MNQILKYIKDKIYYISWYRIKYYDMDWNDIYVKAKYQTFKNILDEQKLILDKFWHLIYFFRKNLETKETLKISKNTFIKNIYKCKQQYFANTFIKWEGSSYHENKLSELLELTLKETEEINI